MLLNTFANHSELIQDPRIHRIVTLQSPLQGTKTAGWTAPLGYVVAKSVNWLQSFNYRQQCARDWELDITLASMNEERTGQMIEQLKNLPPSLVQALTSKVGYVTSHSNREFQLIGQYMMPLEQHDGLVPLRSQSIGSFGQTIANLKDVGHLDLVVGEKTAPNFALQRAFSRTLFSTLTQP